MTDQDKTLYERLGGNQDDVLAFIDSTRADIVEA